LVDCLVGWDWFDWLIGFDWLVDWFCNFLLSDPSNDGNIILVEYSFCASNTKVLKMKKG